jgi:hypothetical protein
MLIGQWSCESFDDGIRSNGKVEFMRQGTILAMRSTLEHRPEDSEQLLLETQASNWRVRKGGSELVEEPRSITFFGSINGRPKFKGEFRIDSFESGDPIVELVAFEADRQAVSQDELAELTEIFLQSVSNSVSEVRYWQSSILRIDESQLILEYQDYVTSCTR